MATGNPGASPLDSVRNLLAAAACDTVYRDLYLGRAAALLTPTLSRAQFAEGRNAERAIAAAVAESRAAALRLDWPRVEEQAQRAEQLRRAAADRAAVMELGEEVYAGAPTALDPFSPGLGQLVESEPRELRDAAVAALAALERGDSEHAPVYSERRAFLAKLNVAARAVDAPRDDTQEMSTADVERRCLEAAERGDTEAMARLATELRTRQAKAAAAPGPAASGPAAAAAIPGGLGAVQRCPVDLAAPLPADAERRAAALGLTAMRAAPLPAAQPIFDFIAAHIHRARPADAEAQRDGAARVTAIGGELGWPSEVSESVRALLDQFLRQTFINSGGARYVPPFGAESILIEDFPEDAEAPATGPLLTALGLPRRRGLSRLEIERALVERGPLIVRDQLGLGITEFRLVCVPPDLYTRVGREKGWGKQPAWTHFDGYQVTRAGNLRALVGGDARYGGLNDLVSIAANDERDGVVARFAVIRRARQVACWA
jgi:hypothetical protein